MTGSGTNHYLCAVSENKNEQNSDEVNKQRKKKLQCYEYQHCLNVFSANIYFVLTNMYRS